MCCFSFAFAAAAPWGTPYIFFKLDQNLLPVSSFLGAAAPVHNDSIRGDLVREAKEVKYCVLVSEEHLRVGSDLLPSHQRSFRYFHGSLQYRSGEVYLQITSRYNASPATERLRLFTLF